VPCWPCAGVAEREGRAKVISTSRIAPLLLALLSGIATVGATPAHAQVEATWVVTTTDDTDDGSCDGHCSLREALSVAAPGDDVEAPGGTYTLTLGRELVIDGVVLTGAGAGETIIEAADAPETADFHVFEARGVVTIAGVTIRHGNPQQGLKGGAINFGRGQLTLEDSVVASNSSWLAKGALHNVRGSVTVRRSTVTENPAGGIANFGTLLVEDSTVSHNASTYAGGGILNYGTAAETTIVGSAVSGNTVAGTFIEGGGISNIFGRLTVADSSVTGNHASGPDADGGGIASSGVGARLEITNTLISGNTAGDDGGGLYADQAEINSSAVLDNTSNDRGGGLCCGDFLITESTVAGNSAVYGGGVLNQSGSTTIAASTVSDNVASFEGGGLYNWGNQENPADLTLTNTTVTGNRAQYGGGIENQGRLFGGGGIAGRLSLTNVTLVRNEAAAEGGGVENFSGTAELVNTIIARNRAGLGPDCEDAFASLGHNLFGDATACDFNPAAGDLVGTSGAPIDPRIGQLADNGGPTLTHSLKDGSPAIDGGDDTYAPSTDQRGVTRPQGVASDIGALERLL
jgi:CSLREA domain-containing protein